MQTTENTGQVKRRKVSWFEAEGHKAKVLPLVDRIIEMNKMLSNEIVMGILRANCPYSRATAKRLYDGYVKAAHDRLWALRPYGPLTDLRKRAG